MASRGRGKGRYAPAMYDHQKPIPHENFPDIKLPTAEETCANATYEEKSLIVSTLKFEEFLRHSCYHLEENAPKKKSEDKEIERFSDRKRKTQGKREALASYLKLTTTNFPAELVQGSRRGQLSNKKLRWDRNSDDQAFDAFEKLEEKQKGGDQKADKESDDDDEPDEEEVEESSSSDDDYNQNVEFDDDDDDWNQEEESQEDYYD